MKRIRKATPEEIESLKTNSSFDPSCMVLALDTMHGTAYAVVRNAIEVDPVKFPEGCTDKMKMIFIRDVETVLAAQGVPCYYFNIHSSEENSQYRSVMEHMGAQVISTEPELRFRKDL